MKKYSLTALILSLLLFSCGGDSFVGGKHQENLERLDKIHGYCETLQEPILKRRVSLITYAKTMKELWGLMVICLKNLVWVKALITF